MLKLLLIGNIICIGAGVLEIIPVANFSRIDMVDCFEDELISLFKNSKNQLKSYKKFLMANLYSLENVDDLSKACEKVKGGKHKIYSIHKSMAKNTRVLYFCTCGNRIVLLTAFDEKNKNDYNKAISRAEGRIKILGLK